MKNLRKWILYLAYVLAATGFFLYTLFPSEAARDYLSDYLGRHYPDYSVRVETVKPMLPPGFKLGSVSMAVNGEHTVTLEQLRVRPKYISLFSKHKTVLINGSAYGGELNGRVELEPMESGLRIQATANLSGIQLVRIEPLQTMSGRKIAGALDSTLGYNNDKGVGGRLEITLNIDDCEVGLTNPLFSINNIVFDRVNAELTVDRRSLKIKRCDAKGNQVDGNLTGVVLFRNPFEKSRLELKGNLKPHHLLMASLKKVLPESLLPKKTAGDKGYPLKLYGTIDKPKFSLR